MIQYSNAGTCLTDFKTVGSLIAIELILGIVILLIQHTSSIIQVGIYYNIHHF